MNPSFHAGFVSIEDGNECLRIGLVDDKFEVGDYLILQRAFEFDEQDVRLGMNNVYIERNDQGRSSYGGIETFELHPCRLRVRFDTRGAQLMAGVRDMEVSFEEGRYEDLRNALERCFKGFPCYTVTAA
jgi:hypothetical protein